MPDRLIRGRVALTMPDIKPVDPPTLADTTWHVGHARSLYLGSLICQSLDIPLDIRLHGERAKAADISAADISGAAVDLANCLNFLGLRFRRLYWRPIRLPSELEIRAELGKNAEGFLAALRVADDPHSLATLCDDVLSHYPSLTIRAVEWLDPAQWFDSIPVANTLVSYIAKETLLYQIADRTRNERSLPLITLGGYKLAKSVGRMIHWDVLTCVAPAVARQFLLATAICPGDPLSIMGDELSVDDIVLDPYEWSWSDWAGVIRTAAQ